MMLLFEYMVMYYVLTIMYYVLTINTFSASLQDDGLNDSEKIAAFDFDGCLANTSVKM